MNPLAILALFVALNLMAASVSAHEAPSHEHTQLVPIPAYSLPYGEAGGSAALAAAEALMASLDEETKSKIMFAFDAKERAGWSNLPAGIVDRVGISIGELTDEQRQLLFAFLASSLGEQGYEIVGNVMAAEASLSSAFFAERYGWFPENYWLSFYGTPSAETPWGWQFGGHHLGLNLSIDGNIVTAMSPSFIGTEPVFFTHNGIDYENLAGMHRAGYALYAALDAAQQAAADAGDVPDNVLTGPGKDDVIPPVIGINAGALNQAQRDLLMAAIAQWVAIQPEENAAQRMSEIAADLEQTHFAWTGSEAVEAEAYMRIQGPTLIIEMVSTGKGILGLSEGHYHTMYRNPTTEYGR